MTTFAQLTAHPGHAGFQQLLADAGVDNTTGVEVLRLVRAVNSTFDSLLAEALRDDALTLPRWYLLLRLWLEEQAGNDGVNPTHLSRVQHVSKNTISDHLRSLEEAGLIERQLDRADRRQFIIRLTAAGRQAVRTSTPGHVRALNELVAGLTPAETEQLLGLLGKLHATLRASNIQQTCYPIA